MPVNQSPLILLALLSTVLLCACGSTPEVSTDYQPHFPFEQLKFYAWIETETSPSEDIRIDNDLVRERVETAVETVLKAKGFTKSDPEQADFLVTWFGIIDRRIRIDSLDHLYDPFWGNRLYGGYRAWPFGFSRTQVWEFETGTLIIDFVSKKDGRLFWRGTGRDYLDENLTPEQASAAVRNTVEAILAQFPLHDERT